METDRSARIITFPHTAQRAPSGRPSPTPRRTSRDEIVLVDDASPDEAVILARELGIRVVVHGENHGYRGNQKTCYPEGLDAGRTSSSCSIPTTSPIRRRFLS